jgi:hypothetical protein
MLPSCMNRRGAAAVGGVTGTGRAKEKCARIGRDGPKGLIVSGLGAVWAEVQVGDW